MTYHLETFDNAVWLVCIVLEIYLMLRICASKTRIPFFIPYLVYNIIKSGILFFVAGTLGYSAYYRTFGVASILGSAFETVILLELLNGLKRWSTIPRETFRICLLLCVALAICLTGMNFSLDVHSFGDLYITINRMLALLQAAVFVMVVLFWALWEMSWRREAGIVTGFGLTAVIQLAVAARISGVPRADTLLTRVYILGHVTGLLAWVWAMSLPDPAEQPAQPASPGRHSDEMGALATTFEASSALAFSHDGERAESPQN